MRFVKTIIAIILTGSTLVGCSATNSSNISSTSELGETVFIQGNSVSSSFTDSRVQGMKGIVQNDQLQLFIDDQTGAIAVLHKQNGEVWYSNDPKRDSDTLASGVNKDMLSSQLKLDYYNSLGQLSSINSYTDSAVHKQIHYELIHNGVKVTYQFGKAVKSVDDLPIMLSAARYEELSSKMDKTGQRALMIAYKKEKETSTYVRNDTALQGLQLERGLKAFEDIGYTEEDLIKDAQEHNLSQAKPEPRVFLASIEYMLDGDGLIVNIPVSDIQFPEEYPINSISALSFFGAGDMNEQGSILVPDGSGALIHFNNGKTKYPAYQQQVYGPDMTMETTEDANQEQKARLPVFGVIHEHSAVLGIIEQGASVATINADINGRLNSYNYVYPSFYVVNKGEVTLNANDQRRSIPKFQEEPMKTDYTVRYVFLADEQASYQGMAQTYQQYLLENNGLPLQHDNQENADSTFYLQLIGSISKQNHFAGIPYDAIEPLTTFEQAQSMIKQLQERNIKQIGLKYSGWFNGDLDHKVPTKVSVDKVIGGSQGLRDFVAFTKEQGISLFPDTALLIANSGDNFNEKKEASRTLREVPATLYPIDLALNRRDRSKSPSYVISPRYVERYTQSMLNGLSGYETDGISLRDLADQLNSDYLKNNQIDRVESEKISVHALTTIREHNQNILANGGNAYAFPYLTNITNAPMTSSQFKIEDEEIPFYQMVLRGYIDYTGAPYNLSTYTNEKQYILKTLEYGSGVYFEWIHEPNYKVKDTDHNDLYAVNYELWIDQAAEIYQGVNEFLKQVSHERIIWHEELEDGVFKTTYENGLYVIVNYNDTQVTADGNIIENEGYITGGDKS
ncbi:DUF5696 domain-containing protein [Paenibacillus crassostreae]|uniref:Lipoprotein n=1 Tax=Paenibacillus crassostreae TaxID=1763538 RepID=A0A167GBQ8_9BACL|nr:DUF5696 domain-containing protein [Paenibacillus crassostreae]AOZ92653.1 hypothetical protein LPB68_10765 [Paenibacillus crassostreae]OAB77422.1 hypothetical protein PNBC_01760 [Paenibacillus crassostreae]